MVYIKRPKRKEHIEVMDFSILLLLYVFIVLSFLVTCIWIWMQGESFCLRALYCCYTLQELQ